MPPLFMIKKNKTQKQLKVKPFSELSLYEHKLQMCLFSHSLAPKVGIFRTQQKNAKIKI